MEENKRELNPEEMQDVNGGTKRPHSDQIYRCEECNFITEKLDHLFDHASKAHHRSPKRSEIDSGMDPHFKP